MVNMGWWYFNSRPHEEVDRRAIERGRKAGQNFNSRPHEEVDVVRGYFISDGDDISTHDLTKRSTKYAMLLI